MRTKKLTLLALLSTAVLFTSSATQAERPEGAGKQPGTEVEQSFMQRWFGWGKRAEENDDRRDEPAKENKKPKTSKAKHKTDQTFNETERSLITDYYRNENTHRGSGNGTQSKKKKLPPGLQKKLERGGELPPGWQMKVNRGEVLDAELLSHAQPLPDDLRNRLPILQDGTELRRIGDNIVRIMEGNGTVLDVIDLADTALRR